MNTSPTEGQQHAGNYAKGHLSIGGLPISIENPAGSVRTGVENGKSWKTKLKAAYGYLKGTLGGDGRHVDAYIKPGTRTDHVGPVHVIDQYNPATGAFDEHKVMIGYGSPAEAAEAYDAHFGDKSGPVRRGAVTQMTTDAFKAWLKNGDTTKPISATKFNGETSDTAQAAQEELALSTGKLSLPRLARLAGETDDAYLRRRADQVNAARAERAKLPTKASDPAAVREALQLADDVPVSILTAASRPDAGSAKGVSKQAAGFIEQVARVFGKRVVFFDVPDRGAAEGFYTRGNTIYLNVNSSTQHLRVLGHELTHAMKKQAGDAYEKMLGAVATLRTDEEMTAQFKDYFGRELGDEKLLDQPHEGGPQTLREFLAEEWMADLRGCEKIPETGQYANKFPYKTISYDTIDARFSIFSQPLSGNRFAESDFWASVFSQLEGQYGDKQARGIIARLRLALVNALNKLKTLIGGNAFAVDARLAEHLEDIRKAVAGGFTEYARMAKTGQLSDAAGTVKFSTGEGKTLLVDGTARPTTNDRGQAIHPTEKGVRNFWKWYADANLLDKQGRPMVLYHGTNQDFSRFKASKTGLTGAGVYLTPDPETSSSYAGEAGGRNLPVYARGRYIGLMAWSKLVQDQGGWSAARAEAERQGIAGIWDQKYENAINVFNPDNIKSAIGNTGAFSTRQKDIHRSPQRAENEIVQRPEASKLSPQRGAIGSATDAGARWLAVAFGARQMGGGEVNKHG